MQVRSLALIALLLMALPALSFAASLDAAQTLTVTASPKDNEYLAGSQVKVSAALPADLLVAAGALEIDAPVGGDISAIGGVIGLKAPVAGDARLVGGRVFVGSDVAGDLALLGGTVRVEGTAGDINAAGADVELLGGAHGPVNAYGRTVTLAGSFAGDVHVAASDRLVIEDGTTITGTLEYNAPQQASIPSSATVATVRYVGSASFLPTAEEARAFAIAGVGVFFLVRLLAAMIAAGLMAGLFPVFAERAFAEAFDGTLRKFINAAIPGLLLFLLTPILIVLLLASFVGTGVAILLGAAYVPLLILGYLYAAILAGSLFARALGKRSSIVWHDGALGMLAFYVIGFIPVVGFLVSFVFSCAAAGAIARLFYRYAFMRDA